MSTEYRDVLSEVQCSKKQVALSPLGFTAQ